jgi:dipeptidyl aminopeptidase/acylaminoacyl peptidase
MKPVRFPARDGLELNGYLTIPNGTGGKNLPLVLAVHGGPFWRDSWGYVAWDQFFANRGYAVLRVNYRGSTGYGRAFMRAAKKQFARKMHDDLIDGVNWAIGEGIADPEKIAIYGRSYGGYATLVGLTFTPEVFAAGVDVVGLSDLVTAFETFPAYWKNGLARWHLYVGHLDNPEDRADMDSRSPINFVERIAKPLLVAQGANDVRVVREHSDRIVEVARKKGLDVEYLVFDDEGHAIRKWRNKMTLARAIERFLAKHLGGRAEIAE